jgi:uncharacterized protein YggE
MKKVFILALFSILLSNTFAQLQNIPLVSAVGESVIKVKPDYAVIALKVKKSMNLATLQTTASFKIFEQNDTKIQLFGFDDKNIDYSLIQADSLVYVKEIFITVNDLENLDKYLLEIQKLGYKDLIYLDYRVKDMSVYKDQARKSAIVSAKRKAMLMASELGQSIGKAHTIEELEVQSFNWYNIDNSKNLENMTYKLGSEAYVIEPGYITIVVKVKVSFDLIK